MNPYPEGVAPPDRASYSRPSSPASERASQSHPSVARRRRPSRPPPPTSAPPDVDASARNHLRVVHARCALRLMNARRAKSASVASARALQGNASAITMTRHLSQQLAQYVLASQQRDTRDTPHVASSRRRTREHHVLVAPVHVITLPAITINSTAPQRKHRNASRVMHRTEKLLDALLYAPNTTPREVDFSALDETILCAKERCTMPRHAPSARPRALDLTALDGATFNVTSTKPRTVDSCTQAESAQRT